MTRRIASIGSIAAVLLLASAAGASAQETSAADGAQPPQGPMTVERVHNTFAIAPEFKMSEIDGRTGRLAGGYAGWVFDGSLFVGGAGYWLTNRSGSVRDMGYGGGLVQWIQGSDRTISYGARGLVGFGSARFADQQILVPVVQDRRDMFLNRPLPQTIFARRTDFFIAEPQADLLVRLTRHVRLDGGIGYRLIGGSRGLDDRLRGVTGSVSLQLGGDFTQRP